jgi:4-amino-4-deoxy-L-arabinose transferase-like glycosyltransferase
MSDAAVPAATPRWKIVFLQLVVLYLLGGRLWFGIAVTPMGDEAYYWMWGQHLSWSYFDHPPLTGWLQGIVAATVGWSNFSVRLVSWLALGGTLWIFWLWAGRLAPHDPQGWFWHSTAIYLAMPVIGIATGMGVHDPLLLFFVLASLYAFQRFAEGWEAGTPAWAKLYLATTLLGLAVLTKYNGVFLGVGYAVWVLVRPKLRPLLLTPHLWLAALLAVAIQFPVFYWNTVEDMASFRFHLSERPSANWAQPRWQQVVSFAGTSLVAISPVLLLATLRLPFLRARSTAESVALGSVGAIYWPSLLAWGVIAAYVQIYLHWNIVAYAALAPVAYRLLGGRVVFLLHLAFGLVLATYAVLTYTTTPLKIGIFGDPGAAANYGWPEVAARVDALQDTHPDAFLGATRYTYAAQLGFMLHQTEVAAFNPVPSQNDYWWPAEAYAGRDAIIVADRTFAIDAAEDRFATLDKLENVAVKDRFGATIWEFEIWLGRDFRPASP